MRQTEHVVHQAQQRQHHRAGGHGKPRRLILVPPLAESRSSTAAVQDAPIHCGCGAMPREPRRPAATWPHAVATRFACHPDPAVAGEGSLKGATLAAQIQRFFARSETFATLLRETIGAGPE
jgi:hypothetical protein